MACALVRTATGSFIITQECAAPAALAGLFLRFFLSLLSFGGQPLHPCPTPNSQLSGHNASVSPVHCAAQPGRRVVQRVQD